MTEEAGLMRWLSAQLGGIRESLGELRATQMGNRQIILQIYTQLTSRIDRMEDRITHQKNGHSTHGWLSLTSINKFLTIRNIVLIVAAILVVTGNITMTELKGWIRQALMLH